MTSVGIRCVAVVMVHLELIAAAAVLQCLCVCGNGEKIPLHFSYITTKTGSFVASGAIPVIDLALEQINNNLSILPNYTLNYTTILDSEVNVHVRGYYYTYCVGIICSVVTQHLWTLLSTTSKEIKTTPMCLSSAVGAPQPPYLLLKSAITGISPRFALYNCEGRSGNVFTVNTQTLWITNGNQLKSNLYQ